MEFKTLYGPVRSGRLGLSLGVDLLGRRICSMDCLYCEVGPTKVHTLKRRPYIPAKVILDELHAWQKEDLPRPEHITLGGLGEPCLNSDLPQIIAGCRDLFPDIPVAILTNSTLLHDPEVRRELAALQVVLPSLDTLVESEFLVLNRPCQGIALSRIISGLLDFRREFAGQLCLEILLLQGINDTAKNQTLLRDYIARLRPDRVDVVTMTRPGASPLASAVDRHTLDAWRSALSAKQDFHQPERTRPQTVSQTMAAATVAELMLNSLRRRPQTPEQLAAALGVDREQAQRTVDDLHRKGLVIRTQGFGDDFFHAIH